MDVYLLKKHKYPQPWTHSHGNDLLGMAYIAAPYCSYDSVPDVHTPKDTSNSTALNGLECVSAYGLSKLAVGDNQGAVHIVDLSWPLKPPTTLHTRHTSSILAMAYGSQGYLATGGRDRVIHIYAAHGECMKKLENHSGAVYKLQFTDDGKRLVSGGADHSVVGEDRVFRYNSMPVTGGKLHDLAVVGNELLVTSTHARVDVHTLISNKPVSSHAIGEHHRISIAPGGSLLGLSGATVDKCVYVADFNSGEILAKAAGHGDTITSIKFSIDGRRLISTSADGCIFVWRLSEDLQALYKSKIPMLSSPVVQEQPPPPVQPIQPEILPPPAPPVASRVPPPKTVQVNNIPLVAPVQPTFQPLDTVATKIELPVEAVQKPWQDGKQPVPGPMAPLELEDWMKTRDVPRFDNDEKKPNNINWQTDRVPDWAKTIKPAQKEELPRPPESKGKWAAQGVVDSIAMVESSSSSESDSESEESQVLYIKQSNGSLQSIEIPMKRTSENIITDVPLSHISHSVTLSQAREIHSKKKRQQEAANAVAEMQAKLGQLGILKKRDDNPLAMDVGINFAAEYYKDIHPLSLKCNSAIEAHDKCSDLSPGELSSNQPKVIPNEATIVTEMLSTTKYYTAPSNLSVEELPSGSLSHFVTGYVSSNNENANPLLESGDSDVSLSNHNYEQELEPINSSFDVIPRNLSLSSFISGHNHSQQTSEPCYLSKSLELTQPKQSLEVCHETSQNSIMGLQESVDMTPLSSSLSLFVAGHNIKSEPPVSLQQSIDMTPTNISLGSFVTEYNDQPAKVTQSIDFTPTNMSLSTFVSGYHEKPKDIILRAPSVENSIDLTPTNASLSTFVSGYHEKPKEINSRASPVEKSIDLTPTNMSLSTFVAGHHGESKEMNLRAPSVEKSFDLTPTNMSLSTFVSGHHENSSPNAISNKHSVDLTPTNVSLSSFTTGHNDTSAMLAENLTNLYSSANSSIDLTPTNVSLSNFVSGNEHT
ncbi:hypothetical protein THRCLA_10082, partial [Thraustotheca clavata]